MFFDKNFIHIFFLSFWKLNVNFIFFEILCLKSLNKENYVCRILFSLIFR